MRRSIALVAVTFVGASCARQEPSSAAPAPPARMLVADAAASDGDAASLASRATDAAALSDEEEVDFSRPRGCAELFETTDMCKRLRSMIGAQTHMKNRACVGRIGTEFSHPPSYSWGCVWNSFRSTNERTREGYGEGPDCFRDRFGGEGVVCGIRDDQHPDDDDVYFETTEAAVRKCLVGWHEEKKASTKSLGDRAFSFSKALDTANPRVVTRIQGCRGSSEPRSIDEQKRSYMRFEIFAERVPAGR